MFLLQISQNIDGFRQMLHKAFKMHKTVYQQNLLDILFLMFTILPTLLIGFTVCLERWFASQLFLVTMTPAWMGLLATIYLKISISSTSACVHMALKEDECQGNYEHKY